MSHAVVTAQAPTGHSTGWSAMAQAVRDFDEERVKDCKEDVDTLLVFAGLFSAVLTAFLTESFGQLQEDKSDLMIQVLQQIASQTANYTFQSGVLITTASAPPPSAPFKASAVAVQLNALWFGSLVLSLMTASFGMLVKQWLREYLAVQYPSPQARLRIRHLRYPTLAQWRVFEIAAFLPVLLQIALGLFFGGLCLFTYSVHQGVGECTISLVAGWAALFVIVTILPAFYPRCPYRTTYLKQALRAAHPWIVAIGGLVSRSFADIRRRVAPGSRHTGTSSCFRLLPHWTNGFARMLSTCDESDEEHEEAAVVKTERADLDILVSVDALQLNDELLGTTIMESLTQLRPSWNDAQSFVLRILKNRNMHIDPRTHAIPADLKRLSRRAELAVLDILAQQCTKHLASIEAALDDAAHYVPRDIIPFPSEMVDVNFALRMLLSTSVSPLPHSSAQALKTAIGIFDPVDLIRNLSLFSAESSVFEHLPRWLRKVNTGLSSIDADLQLKLACFSGAIEACFRQSKQPLPNGAVEIHRLHVWPWLKSVTFRTCLAVTAVLADSVAQSLKVPHNQRRPASASALVNGFTGVLRLGCTCVRFYDARDFVRRPSAHMWGPALPLRGLLGASLTSVETGVAFLTSLLLLPMEDFLEPILGTAFCAYLSVNLTQEPNSQRLSTLRAALQELADSDTHTLSLTESLRLSYVVMLLVQNLNASKHGEETEEILTTIAGCVRMHRVPSGCATIELHHDDQECVERCLILADQGPWDIKSPDGCLALESHSTSAACPGPYDVLVGLLSELYGNSRIFRHIRRRTENT